MLPQLALTDAEASHDRGSLLCQPACRITANVKGVQGAGHSCDRMQLEGREVTRLESALLLRSSSDIVGVDTEGAAACGHATRSVGT